METFLLDGAARRLANGTLVFYREKLTAFINFLETQGITDLGQVTPEHVRLYLVDMQKRGLAANTQHGTARALRAWCNFLVREGDLAVSPMRRVRMPRPDNRIPPAFSHEHVQALLAACRHNRDRALLLCMLDTGCRASEIIALDIIDVEIETGAVQVRAGKGGKNRTVYLGAKAQRALHRYLRARERKHQGETTTTALWVSLTTGERLTVDGLRLLLQRLGRRAGVEHCHPHTFRRTFALWSLRAGMNIYVLQQLMGHNDITVLRRYLALVENDLKAAHHQHGPVDTFL